ncbi:ATPase, T2SS/T4P/T4SS family [Natrononativus amylolyticus]|uniref:ATPase, T2SS/T4P/T4SS family n=1 Tax=Natrononativus amylolyticus TaxID=2963434 RepID=UPI0020CDDEAB|nr:ATPase, T2SS/T4P/T4SS family [Natrononativus amylolyticus]
MAIDEADRSDAGQVSDGEPSAGGAADHRTREPTRGADVRVGEYTWAEFMAEYGHGDEVSLLYPHGTDGPDDQLGIDTDEEPRSTAPSAADWDRVEFDPTPYLGYDPLELSDLITDVFGPNANYLQDVFLEYVDPETTPVVKDVYTWEHYKWEYYYDEDGNRPRDDDGEIVRHDEKDALGFDPDRIEAYLHAGGQAASELDDLVDERTVNVAEDIDEDEFFSTADGHTTVVNRYDLEKAVSLAKKQHFTEVERYWVNKPYAFVIIFHSEKENEKKYYMIEPYLTAIETELQEFLSGKLRTAIKYSDDGIKQTADEESRRAVIDAETRRLLERYDLYEGTTGTTNAGIIETLKTLLDDEEDGEREEGQLEGIEARPEPVLLEEDSDVLSEYQVEKLLHLLKRDFIGYERIDGIKHDINVEDISCDGYNSPVFVYHSEYEQIISNIYHGQTELDDFVVKLAQRSGKGISKRLPQVDATLPDGSRAQLTLGKEVSDHGTNYTIRQFKDVPFTPIDLINWNTFSLEEMAFLWLAIENHKSLIFAGGTASGKTTSLNAVSLFIPSATKIVSIEDTREVELPQRNWIASVTRPSFSDDSTGDVDEFDLLEAALRQRPDYIVMGEIRGEEGRTLFQVMSTGHTTYTTFHADSVDEVLKRFTTDPINVSKTMFTALDLVSIQTQTRVQGRKVRRNKSLTEINHYEAEHDEINVQDVYQWQAETDEYLKMGDSNTLDAIQFDRGWSYEKLQDELFKRQIILAYLIKNELNTYAQVAATIQAFINDPDTILTLIANGQLEDSLEDLREMESVLIDVDPEKEELVPRPGSTTETYNTSMDILERAEESLFEDYRGKVPSGLASALGGVEAADPIEVDDEFEDEWDFGDGDEFTFGTTTDDENTPSWLDDDGGFEIGADTEPAEPSPAEAAADAETSAGNDAETPERPALEAPPEDVEADSTPAEPATIGDDSNAAPAAADADETEDVAEASESPADAPETAPEPESGGAERAADATAADESETAELSFDETAEVGDDEEAGGGDDEEADLGGLFDDMEDTLENLGSETPDSDAAREEAAGESLDGARAGDGDESVFDDRSSADDDGREPIETGSIFGDESESIFGGDSLADADDGGSMFEPAAAIDEEEDDGDAESIFEADPDDEGAK